MKTLMVLPEISPFVRTGRLADTLNHLIFNMSKEKPVLILPHYKEVKIKAGKIIWESSISKTQIHESLFPDSDDKILFIKPQKGYFHFLTNADYPEEIFNFSATVTEFLKERKEFRLVHCHNWQTALIPLLIKNDPELENIRTLFTFHSLYQPAVFPIEDMRKINSMLREEIKLLGSTELIKLGIVFADALSTTSKQYTEDILSEEYGNGFESFLQLRKNDLYGIMNGVRYGYWNPEKDHFIKEKYSKEDLTGKRADKIELQKIFNLPVNDHPLFCFGGRLKYRKGIDLVIDCLEELSEMKIQLLLCGTGEEEYHFRLRELENKYDNIRIKLDFNEEMAHKILAGADFMLLPTRYEAGGISHLYALKYGTIPVARKTGGLVDAIFDQTYGMDKANGFLFSSYYENSLISIIQEAADVYNDKALFVKYIRNAMNEDWSWKVAVKQYKDLYRKIIANNL